MNDGAKCQQTSSSKRSSCLRMMMMIGTAHAPCRIGLAARPFFGANTSIQGFKMGSTGIESSNLRRGLIEFPLDSVHGGHVGQADEGGSGLNETVGEARPKATARASDDDPIERVWPLCLPGFGSRREGGTHPASLPAATPDDGMVRMLYRPQLDRKPDLSRTQPS